jgi:hypothetical protein
MLPASNGILATNPQPGKRLLRISGMGNLSKKTDYVRVFYGVELQSC